MWLLSGLAFVLFVQIVAALIGTLLRARRAESEAASLLWQVRDLARDCMRLREQRDSAEAALRTIPGYLLAVTDLGETEPTARYRKVA